MLDDIEAYKEYETLPAHYKLSADMYHMLDLKQQLEQANENSSGSAMDMREIGRLQLRITAHRDSMLEQGRLGTFGEDLVALEVAVEKYEEIQHELYAEYMMNSDLLVKFDNGNWLDEVESFKNEGVLPADYQMSDGMRGILEIVKEAVNAEGLESAGIKLRMYNYLEEIRQEGGLYRLDAEFDLLTDVENAALGNAWLNNNMLNAEWLNVVDAYQDTGLLPEDYQMSNDLRILLELKEAQQSTAW